MYPIPTNTPAGCSGNRQSRSIGEDGDTGSDATPRVLLYMDIIPCLYVSLLRLSELSQAKEDKQISPPHAISSCCYGGWRYGRHRAGEKPVRVIWAYGI